MRTFPLLLSLLSFSLPAFAQPADDVHATPIEIGAAASYDFQRDGTPDVQGGGGAIVAVAGNLNDHVAVVTELAHSPRMHTILAGGRLSTGFFREGSGRFPGRFFLDALAGRNRGGAAAPGATIQLGAGADVIVVPRGLALHWALDYQFTPAARHDFAGARVSVGFVVGPHLKSSRPRITGAQEGQERSGETSQENRRIGAFGFPEKVAPVLLFSCVS